MPVNQQYGSYSRVYVSPVQGILTTGSTFNLAAGQVGIFDGDTYQAVTAPSFFQNKSIIVGQGLNPTNMPLMAGIPNSFSEKTENIKGGAIVGWRGYRGHMGQNELLAVGYDGADATKTLGMRRDEVKYLYIKLTGLPINKLYSDNGLVLRYSVGVPLGDCCDADCDSCTDVDCNQVADALVKKINADEGLMKHRGMIRAYKKVYCTTAGTPAPTIVNYNSFILNVFDDGTDAALGRVRAQYPGVKIDKVDRNTTTNMSTYRSYTTLTAIGAPYIPYVTSIGSVVPNCATCPAGYTPLVAGLRYFQLVVPTGAAPTIAGGTVTKLSESGGDTTYSVTTALGSDINATLALGEALGQMKYIKDTGPSCTNTTPVTTAWVDATGTLALPAGAEGFSIGQEFRLTLKDSDCGTDYLTALIAAYASIGTVTAVAVTPASGGCVHIYSITVQSQIIASGCTTEEPVWQTPPAYLGISWVKYTLPASVATGCSCGVWIEAAFVNRITNACTYGTFPFEADGVHIQASNFDPDYNQTPGQGNDWPITPLRKFMQVTNYGAAIQMLEEKSREMFLKRFSYDVATRDAENFLLFATANQFYDQYALEYIQHVNTAGFTDTSKNRHVLNVYYPVTLGKAYETAINSYVSSNPGLGLSPISL